MNKRYALDAKREKSKEDKNKIKMLYKEFGNKIK